MKREKQNSAVARFKKSGDELCLWVGRLLLENHELRKNLKSATEALEWAKERIDGYHALSPTVAPEKRNPVTEVIKKMKKNRSLCILSSQDKTSLERKK